ncbi:MAG: hypothetical protein PHV18_15925 [Lachnospiraceae bacterium]|nr:hypothetical protein [Lachnospiraceae bacterium]
MKKTIMRFIGAMMILSLAACTPTTEKNKTGEVKQTEAVQTAAAKNSGTKQPAKSGVAAERGGDSDAPNLDVISIYHVSEDGTKLAGTMESIETMEAQPLVDLLIQYGSLPEGTKAVSFAAEGEPASVEAGPGMVAPPGFTISSNMKENGTLELSQIAEDAQKDLKLQAVANTFLENMDVMNLTIKVNGKTVGENMTFVDAGK